MNQRSSTAYAYDICHAKVLMILTGWGRLSGLYFHGAEESARWIRHTPARKDHHMTTTSPNTPPTTNTASSPLSLLTRQPPAALTRIAFWAFLVAGLGGIAGAIAITIGSGAPSRDIVTTTLLALASAGILATRLRWAPIVSSVLGAYNLFLVFTEPYAVESLAIPKGPNGGYGHFVGVVFASALAIVALGASIAAAVRTYRGSDPRAPRWLPAAASVVAGMVIGALFIGAVAAPPLPAGGGTIFTNGVPTVYMGAGNFVESSVTIPKGAKLLLVDNTSAVHILVNGSWQNGVAKSGRESAAPVVDNVHVSGNSVEIGPFTTVGTYHIYCLVHPGMNLTVIVE
jgi:hypothetical protein